MAKGYLIPNNKHCQSSALPGRISAGLSFVNPYIQAAAHDRNLWPNWYPRDIQIPRDYSVLLVLIR